MNQELRAKFEAAERRRELRNRLAPRAVALIKARGIREGDPGFTAAFIAELDELEKLHGEVEARIAAAKPATPTASKNVRPFPSTGERPKGRTDWQGLQASSRLKDSLREALRRCDSCGGFCGRPNGRCRGGNSPEPEAA